MKRTSARSCLTGGSAENPGETISRKAGAREDRTKHALAVLGVFLAAACQFAVPVSAKNIAHNLESPLGRPMITVYMYQDCEMPAVVQTFARSTVVELFARIDVSIRFTYNGQTQTHDNTIAVQLVRHAGASVESELLGSALVSSASHREVKIFCDRLTEYHNGDWLETGRLLGCAIAHELGHVLRGDSSHSLFGLMKARWRHSEVVSMRQGNLRFTAEDAQRIHQVWEQRWRAKRLKTGQN